MAVVYMFKKYYLQSAYMKKTKYQVFLVTIDSEAFDSERKLN